MRKMKLYATFICRTYSYSLLTGHTVYLSTHFGPIADVKIQTIQTYTQIYVQTNFIPEIEIIIIELIILQ